MKNIFLIIENPYSWIIAGIFMGIITLLCLFDGTSTSVLAH